jgi:protein transport protein SEC61 subunit alpha
MKHFRIIVANSGFGITSIDFGSSRSRFRPLVSGHPNMGTDIRELRRVLRFVPTISTPHGSIDTGSRHLYTFGAVVCYLACSLTPLYGVFKMEREGFFSGGHFIIASSQGSLMELGISVSVFGWFVGEFLRMISIIRVNESDDESIELSSVLDTLIGYVVAAFLAFWFIERGDFGSFDELGAAHALIIHFQIMLGSMVARLLAQLIDEWGISLAHFTFVGISVWVRLIWKLLSFLGLAI